MDHVEIEMVSVILSNEWKMVQTTILDSIATITQWEVEVPQEDFVEAAVACSIMATHVEEVDLEPQLIVEVAEVS